MKGREEGGNRSGFRWSPHAQRQQDAKDPGFRPEEREIETFGAEELPDLDKLLREASLDAPDLDAERMNRKVMDRIYAESPWLLPGEAKTYASQHRFRSRAAVWIAALLAVFLVSFIYLAGWGIPDREQSAAGSVPAGVIVQPLTVEAGTSDTIAADEEPASGRGIVEPLVAQIGPTHPQYWMFLSLTGMGLALLSLTRIATMRK
ncbi:anti-sigma factor [Saccharibacillus sp. CPCC 101409]|uniref:anti-sigma factor n=1 Tax=Saccharibacillus sp. CPCC 101409 TaxID=3058041 RepID=UPI0026738AE8|nr:anti-sigma factor [Saccharibacillus sp. CPCC 101409]MDO3409629.1 anti-sigma factor [Saccharibacillus sp. CPCC 101409]